MKEIRRKNHTIENPKYLIFDCLSLEEFDTHGSIVTLSERLNRLPIEYINPFCWLSWDEFDTLAPVEQILIETEEQFTDLVKDAELNGYEGIMIRRNAGYEGSRSHNLLKVKKFTDAEYTVISCDMGPIRWSINGENLTIDCLTNVNIMHKGTVVSVGSGFTREQREYYYAHPEELIGKTICVKYFEESLNKNNQYSLRFPVVKHIYENGREF
jgi:DNA ligase-1